MTSPGWMGNCPVSFRAWILTCFGQLQPHWRRASSCNRMTPLVCIPARIYGYSTHSLTTVGWLTTFGTNELDDSSLVMSGRIRHPKHQQLTNVALFLFAITLLSCCTARGRLLLSHERSHVITCDRLCSLTAPRMGFIRATLVVFHRATPSVVLSRKTVRSKTHHTIETIKITVHIYNLQDIEFPRFISHIAHGICYNM
jgi:hypothetical protein